MPKVKRIRTKRWGGQVLPRLVLVTSDRARPLTPSVLDARVRTRPDHEPEPSGPATAARKVA